MSSTPVGELQDRLNIIQSNILNACERSGRRTDEITLVAVTKTLPRDEISKACALGIVHLGENRVQETIDKYSDGNFNREFPGTCLHMIGHLQSNKVRKVLPLCATVDSVDSIALAKAIDQECETAGFRRRVLLEVNTSGEPQKFGIRPADLFETIEKLLPLRQLDLMGVMTVGPLTDNPRTIRQSFRILRHAFDEIQSLLNPPGWSVVSMGMSGDYPVAIEEGATEIRLGTALFGERRTG